MQNKNEWGNPPYHSKNPYKVKHNAKYIRHYIWNWIILLFFAAAFVLLLVFGCGCTTIRTGYYTIEEVRPFNTVTFKGVPGDWHLESDTIKPGDKVYLKRTLKLSKANVW